MNYTFDELNTLIKKMETYYSDDISAVKVALAPHYSMNDDQPIGYLVYKMMYGKDDKRGMYVTSYNFNELNMMLRKK